MISCLLKQTLEEEPSTTLKASNFAVVTLAIDKYLRLSLSKNNVRKESSSFKGPKNTDNKTKLMEVTNAF